MLRRVWVAGTAAGATVVKGNFRNLIYQQKYYSGVAALETIAVKGENERRFHNNNWLVLPAFSTATDGSAIGKKLYGQSPSANMTTLKWVLKCYPELPRCLVQKLFRLRRVRKKCSDSREEVQPRRVSATDIMKMGDVILLPKSVIESPSTKSSTKQSSFDEEECRFARSLVLYKDADIIAVNKPPGLPVQGGLGIKKSLDELAAKYLRYDLKEYPRLVHRLDRDSSGILVMGRTQLSATILHSIFREKTHGVSCSVISNERTLQKKYLALVIGSPRRQEGLVSVPLMKVVVDNGKSDRITVTNNRQSPLAQHAVTKYRVLDSTSSDYTWLELSPLTGRKHQVLGTPIVGDYKYGWQAHKKLGLSSTSEDGKHDETSNAGRGSICDGEFLLHLHCKEMVLPDISQALSHGDDFNELQVSNIQLDAPLPSHMQKSWELLNNGIKEVPN